MSSTDPTPATRLAWPAELRHCVTRSAEETQEFGRRLARALPRPALVILNGELGSGKTTLVKGIAEGLGVAREEDVASPSYTLIHEYSSPTATLHHIDLYRLETSPQLATLGLEDILSGGVQESSLVAVEWGGKFPLFERLPRLVVTFTATGTATGDEAREIDAEWRGGA